VRDRIEALPGVRAASAAIQLAGVLMNGDRSVAFAGAAIEPARQRRMGIDVKLRAGAPLPDATPTPGEDPVLLGVDLARALNVAPGDGVVAMVGTAAGTLNAIDLIVTGVFTTGLQDLDARVAQLHVATAQRLLATDSDTSLLVGLDDDAATGRMARLIRENLPAGRAAALAVTDWETRAPFYRQVRGLYIGIFLFLGTIIGLLVALSTSNTFQMSVLERVREFGLLLAMGTDRVQLARLVAMEGVWLAILGGVAGSVLSIAAALSINALEIQMPPPPAAVDPLTLSVYLQPPDFAWAILFMVLLLVAATVPPILRIFRLQVVEALGHV
jgi:putative ABC transport system permease protein